MDVKAVAATPTRRAGRVSYRWSWVLVLLLVAVALRNFAFTQGGKALLQPKIWGDPNSEAQGLIFFGADVNTVGEDGNRPLFYAVAGGNLEDVKTVLRNGATPNFSNKSGDTPLSLAMRIGRQDLVDLLRRYGAR